MSARRSDIIRQIDNCVRRLDELTATLADRDAALDVWQIVADLKGTALILNCEADQLLTMSTEALERALRQVEPPY